MQLAAVLMESLGPAPVGSTDDSVQRRFLLTDLVV